MDIDPSIIYQVDALTSKLLGHDTRIDIDLFAPSAEASYCEPYAWQKYDDIASFNVFYFHDPGKMPGVVASMARKKVFGVAIVPMMKGAGPWITPKPSIKGGPKPRCHGSIS